MQIHFTSISIIRAAARTGRLCVALLALAAGAANVHAQGTPSAQQSPSTPTPSGGAAKAQSATPNTAPSAPRLVSGRIVRPVVSGMVPVPDIWVTLHRVGPDMAAPLDSMRTGRDGRYTFRYRATGSNEAVYFVSASYDGIAYFSLPLRDERVTGTDAEIAVYDTTAGPVPLHVRGRHLVISSPGVDGTREVVEVYEISNDSSVTLVSPDDSRPTWTGILPAAAEQFEVGQGDISPRSVHAEKGRVTTVAPFAPGVKQVSFAYRLPAKAFPLAIPLEHEVSVVEVLLEEPAAHATGGGLTAVAPVTVERRNFQRYLAQDVPRNAVITIDTPAVSAPPIDKRFVVGLAIVIAVAMAGAFVLVLARRRGTVPARASTHAAPQQVEDDERARLARAIAALDAEFERRANPSEKEREEYRARRDALKRELAREMVSTSGAVPSRRE